MAIVEKNVYSAAATLMCWSCLEEFAVHEECVTDEIRKGFVCDVCLREEERVDFEEQQKEYQGYQDWQAPEGLKEIYFADYPFVVTVAYTKWTENSYLADWWVSGTNLELQQPRLVLRLGSVVIADDLQELQEEVEMLWSGSLRQIAIDSVMMGGFAVTGFHSGFDYTRDIRERIVRYHLMQHDNNWRGGRRSKVLLTAGWHNMTKQFGINQTQQLIAQHEQHLDILDLLDPSKREAEDRNLKTSHINQRLKLAKDEGLVERKER
jgi:hypothetical protein